MAPPAVCVRRGYAEGDQQHGAVPAHHHAPGGTQPGLSVSWASRNGSVWKRDHMPRTGVSSARVSSQGLESLPRDLPAETKKKYS